MAKPLLPDALWELIEPLLPPPKPRRGDHPGRLPLEDRKALTGILFVLKTGIPWADLPREMGCGCGMSCWRRVRDWQAAGVWPKLHALLLDRLRAAGKIDWTRAAVDSAHARAFAGAADSGPSPVDRGRPGVKHHILVDANGVPLVVDRTPGNTPDGAMLLDLVDDVPPVGGLPGAPKSRPAAVYADRAYDDEASREELRDRGIDPHLAKRRTEHGSGLGVYRWVVERTLGWLHGFRKLRLVTEKTVDMQYAFLDLAASVICFRILTS